ncbi:hypothetical protein [Shewanella halotolerans]|uniref:hypothetical protein n=1 Tax=Shewanella halotolerans TaxID=2864204 RepID=UPI001C657D4D|nr:hypothetical protein [Shewanella halotolerans]QYJ89782.1 hypothetical protein K0H81_18795 [Shewanella halotolerans]
MDKQTRHQKILEKQLEQKGYVAHLINRGEQVKYYDGTEYVEGEVTWSWEGSKMVAPLHIHTNTLHVANPPELRRELQKSEQLMIAQRIQSLFIEQGTDAVIE